MVTAFRFAEISAEDTIPPLFRSGIFDGWKMLSRASGLNGSCFSGRNAHIYPLECALWAGSSMQGCDLAPRYYPWLDSRRTHSFCGSVPSLFPVSIDLSSNQISYISSGRHFCSKNVGSRICTMTGTIGSHNPTLFHCRIVYQNDKHSVLIAHRLQIRKIGFAHVEKKMSARRCETKTDMTSHSTMSSCIIEASSMNP